MTDGPDGKRKTTVLRGYGQIRAFFREMGFAPPPHEATLYKWARRKGCPIYRANDGGRVVAKASELGVWIRKKYFGSRVGHSPPAPDDNSSD